MKQRLEAWRVDPVAFIAEALINPETGKPFELYPAQVEFLRRAFTLTATGRLPFPEIVFSAPKKSGKTGLAAMVAIYVAVVLSGPYGEVYCLANDYEQAASRVFQAAARIIEASPLLRHSAKVTANRIEFRSTGTFIQACASDYSGFAGSNPSLTICDELWGFVHESSRRLFDEAVPSPTRKVSARLTVTYAGFEGESTLLEGLHKRGMAAPEVAPDLHAGGGIICYWTNRAVAPWQTPEWLDQMRLSLRANQFARMIENRWVTTESTFVDMGWFDSCVDPELRPLVSDRYLPVWGGVDASVKRDSTAIAVCGWDTATRRARLIWHRIFQPSPTDPLDFEATIEKTLLELRERFQLREVRFDPYQMQAVAQRLTSAGLPMVEFPQSVPNLTEASTNLYELIKGRNLAVYADAEIRLAVARCVAIETSRGWRIAKEKQSHKIDVVVAMAQAALGATMNQAWRPGILEFMKAEAEREFEIDEAAKRGSYRDGVPTRERPQGNRLIEIYNRTREAVEAKRRNPVVQRGDQPRANPFIRDNVCAHEGCGAELELVGMEFRCTRDRWHSVTRRRDQDGRRPTDHPQR